MDPRACSRRPRGGAPVRQPWVSSGAVTYLKRIGYAGPLEPTFDTLAASVGLHVRAIPFENLDVLLGRPPRLDLPALRGKLVDSQRGGYCYEHASLCAAELEALGFTVARHSARVVMV